MQTKTDLDSMYEQMGNRWAVVKIWSSDGEKDDPNTLHIYHITAHPQTYKEGEIVTTSLMYSEAIGLKKLLEAG